MADQCGFLYKFCNLFIYKNYLILSYCLRLQYVLHFSLTVPLSVLKGLKLSGSSKFNAKARGEQKYSNWDNSSCMGHWPDTDIISQLILSLLLQFGP